MGAAAARRPRLSPFVWGLLARRAPRPFSFSALGLPRNCWCGLARPAPEEAARPRSPRSSSAPLAARRPPCQEGGSGLAGRLPGEGSRRAGPAGGRRAGPRPRRAHTHPLLVAGGRAGRRGQAPGDRDLGDPRALAGLGSLGGCRGRGAAGASPEGRGRPLCPLALGGGGAVCTPLRSSRSSADGWDLKFFLPLWKSGRMGGVAMATAPPLPYSLRGRP